MNTIIHAQKESALPFRALSRSPTKGLNRIHEEKMRPAGRILTYMLLDFEMFGRISAEQRVALMLHCQNGRGWIGERGIFALIPQFTDL